MKLNLRRPVPLWLFLVGLLLVGSVAAGLAFLPPLLSPKDFSIRLSPSQQIVIGDPTSHGSGAQVIVKSLHGFIGRVSLKAVTPSNVNVSFSGVGSNFDGRDLLLGSDNALLGLNATADMNVYAQATGNFSITVVGTSGSLSHSETLRLIAQDVAFSQNPPSVIIQQGSSLTTSLSLTSINGFAGNVTFNSALSSFPDWFLFKVSVSPSTIFVPPRATVTTSLNMSADEFTPPSNGTVSVLATTFASSFGSQSWLRTTPVQIRLAPELLTVSSYVFNSNSNATLWIRNDGPLRVLINQYNVTDSLGNSYYWCLQSYVACGSSPLQINSANLGGLNVLVGTNCTTLGGPPRCQVYGSQFTFQTGHSYTVTVQTSRYHLFTKVISF